MPESARDTKRNYLFAFEQKVNDLIQKELRLKYGPGVFDLLAKFYSQHAHLRTGMWVNAHMHADMGIHEAGDAGCFFFFEICSPRLRAKQYQDVETDFRVYHVTVCPACSKGLTGPGSVEVSFCCNDHVFEHRSQVTGDGKLVDVDGLVRHGYHAGTCCNNCGEQLDDLTVPGAAEEVPK